MWNPAIEFTESQACTVDGWRRSFCFWMPMGRGTPELPGLMLALEEGGTCEGIAYRLARASAQRARPPVESGDAGGAYRPCLGATRLRDGRTVTAVTFAIDTSHCQYCGDLSMERVAHHIASRRRPARRLPRLSANTAAHTRALDIHDPISRSWCGLAGPAP